MRLPLAHVALSSLLLSVAVSVKPGPLKVFLLAGQSNMEGQSPIDEPSQDPKCTGCPHRNGTLAWMVFNETRESVTAWSKNLWVGDEATGSWLKNDNVWMWGNENLGTTNWTVGNGFRASTNGPEYGFGYAMGSVATEQVLLAKWSVGGTSLAHDWRPPSAGGQTGPLYNQSLADWKALLTTANLTALYPAYNAAAGFEIAGMLWVQGWQDGCVQAMADEYESNMAYFISDMRAALGVPKMPFAISAFGVAGFAQAEARRAEITQAQLNVANCTLHPELGCGTVATAETRDVWRMYEETGGAINQNYHYNGNAEIYWYFGTRTGALMAKMLGWPAVNASLLGCTPLTGPPCV